MESLESFYTTQIVRIRRVHPNWSGETYESIHNNPIKLKTLEKIHSAYRNIPDRYKYVFLKAMFSNRASKAVIKAKCQECCGYEDLSNAVGLCKAYACPLWAHRPYQQLETKDSL